MKKNNLSLTVLICVHSQNDFYDELLIKSIKSLEEQTYKTFKTIIVLDECWDKTIFKLENMNTNLDIEFKMKEFRSGLHDAKNYGLGFVETDLVAFLDADDLYLPTKLERQIEFFKGNEVDFLGTCRWEIKNDDETNFLDTWLRLEEYITHDHISENIEDVNMLTHGSMMIKKSCLVELGGYKEQKGSEDWELWKRAIKNGYKFYQLPEKLYVYRCGTSNIR